jgi:AraC family transcriptional regulator
LPSGIEKRAEAGQSQKPETQGLNAMLNSSSSFAALPLKSFGDHRSLRNHVHKNATLLYRPAPVGDREGVRISRDDQSAGFSIPTVDAAPKRGIKRNSLTWPGMGVELVKATTHERVDYGFNSRLHLLVAYHQGVRRDGESYVEGLPRSSLRDVAQKLTFVPAGRQYREWHDPRIPTDITYFYFDPAELEIDTDDNFVDLSFEPRLLFEDAGIWNILTKLRQAAEAPGGANTIYIEALGVVLIHELIRLNSGTPRAQAAAVKGGLAAWQQRMVTTYIEEHLSEQISIATLARLARLSTFHFCRAFKQSFGVPPHRYHTNRRIERAKIMLAERKHSVTEIGLTVGFSETSSFSAVFRKVTGQTPSRYHRGLD